MVLKLIKIRPWLLLLLLISACKVEEQYNTIYPKEYFPAFPGSYWVYSNGVTKTTHRFYQIHTVNGEDVYVPEYDGKTVVEYFVGGKEIINFNGLAWNVGSFDGMDISREIINYDTTLFIVQFPYNDTAFCDTIITEIIPADTSYALREVASCDGFGYCDTLLVNCINDTCDTVFYALFEDIVPQDTIIYDTLITNCDSITQYNSVIVVKEFVASLDELDCWFYKEYYAKDVGLVKREVASCSDSTAYITEFELIKHHINK